MTSKAGFTLVELLVVSSIIVVLLAMLTPALDSATDSAQRAVCAATLDAHSVGMNQYALDARRRYLAAPRHFGHQVAYPLAAYMYATTHPSDWSVEAMNPYLGLGPPVVGGLPQIWRCPSNDTAYNDDEWDRAVKHGRGATSSHDGSLIHSSWAVYAGVERWKSWGTVESVASDPQDLARSQVGSRGIIMADSIYRWSGNGGVWIYNHGDYRVTDTTPMPIVGVNRAYGDGAVEWQEFSEARRTAIVPGIGDPQDQRPFVSHNGGPNGDLEYY